MDRNNILGYAVKKVDQRIKLNDFPHITENGKWTTTEDGYWTGGFWVGMLLLVYKITGDERYKAEAYNWAKRLENRKNDKTFDLSFLFYPSFVLGYDITGDRYFRKVALEAAETLSTLFHEKASFVYNKIDEKIGRTIIDAMPDLQLLWWAYEETGGERFYEVARTHSMRTVDEFIRDDYSTVHVIDFDLETGELQRKITVQGYSDDSCWSRGQAWAIYGFTLAYKHTRDELFLRTAEKLAEYFIKNLPEDYVPYWDFNDPKKELRDSSAAAIASSGLLDLSALSGKKGFRDVAINILSSLCDNYLCEEEKDGILKHGCFHKPEEKGADESLIWGDYYFIEAIMKMI
ncbi:MAG: glycoside hydrolase family 88 protein [Methanophagales archaeon]|nr:glycoside hydrolase family 88 protein [Methanophagales archaeon]